MRFLLSAFLVMACEPFGPGGDPPGPPIGGQGQLYIDTDRLDFGERSVIHDGAGTLQMTIRNTGEGLLKVAGLDRSIGDALVFESNAPPLLELEPNQSEDITVVFTPTASGSFQATLVPNGEKTIVLTGIGLAPEVSVEPTELTFESQPVGCSSQKILEVKNTGEEALSISSASISGSSDFVIDMETPLELAPGESTNAFLVFSPTIGSLHTSVLQIVSNDPAVPIHTTHLEAIGYEGEAVKESFDYRPYGRSDLLLVVNDHPQTISRIDANTPDIENLLTAIDGLDWRIAVTNLNSYCHLTNQAWLSSEDDVTSSTTALVSALSQNGPGGTKLFEKALSILERSDPGDCMDGFLRADSLLQIAFISHMTDNSSDSVGTNISRMEAQLTEGQELSISAFSGIGTGGCSNSPRLHEAAETTEGDQVDLCDQSLTSFFQGLSDRAQAQLDANVSLALAEHPVVSTLSIYTDQKSLSNWQYLSSTNQVVVDGTEEELTEGEVIHVDYLAQVDCQ